MNTINVRSADVSRLANALIESGYGKLFKTLTGDLPWEEVAEKAAQKLHAAFNGKSMPRAQLEAELEIMFFPSSTKYSPQILKDKRFFITSMADGLMPMPF